MPAQRIFNLVWSLFTPGSIPGANRPIGPWPIHSVAKLPPGQSLPAPFTPWPFRSLELSLPKIKITTNSKKLTKETTQCLTLRSITENNRKTCNEKTYIKTIHHASTLYKKLRLQWRLRVPIGNNGAMHFNAYPEVHKHARSLLVHFNTIWVLAQH